MPLDLKNWQNPSSKNLVEKIPDAKEELLSLPGVGQCIAFGKDESLADTNIVRVLERVFNVKSRKKDHGQTKRYGTL